MSRLQYRVLVASSEDPDFPATELHYHSSKTKGWSSSRFCDYPQELGLVFQGEVSLRQIQFLAHQNKITSKIELYVDTLSDSPQSHEVDALISRYFGSAADQENADAKNSLHFLYEHRCQFKRLGYLSLDSNERSAFQARELKSVYVDHKTRFLKIRLHKCHVNRFNLANQVALVAINVLGDDRAPPPDLRQKYSHVVDHVGNDPQGNGANPYAERGPSSVYRGDQGGRSPGLHPIGALSANQSMRVPGVASASPLAPSGQNLNSQQNGLGPDPFAQYHPKIAAQMRELALAKEHAVEVEDYQEAKRYKDLLENLKSVSSQIGECEARKTQAVAEEDYDLAKRLKSEIDGLYRRAMEGKVHASHHSQNGGGGATRDTTREEISNKISSETISRSPVPGAGGGGSPGLAPQGISASIGSGIPPERHPSDSLVDAGYGSSGTEGEFTPRNPNDSPEQDAYNRIDNLPVPSLARPSSIPAAALAEIGPETDPNSIRGMDFFRMGSEHNVVPTSSPAVQKETTASLNNPESTAFGGHAGSLSKGARLDFEDAPIRVQHQPPDPSSFANQIDQGDSQAPAVRLPASASHPLAGVPGAEELPEPEGLSSTALKELAPLLTVLDEYLVSCLHSKTRTLREAGLTKLHLDLRNDRWALSSGGAALARDMLQALGMVLKRTAADKIANIFLLCMQVLQSTVEKVLRACESSSDPMSSATSSFFLKKQDTQPILETLLPLITERLGETNARCSQTAANALIALALCPNVGANYISTHVMNIKNKKTLASARVYCNRVKILSYLVNEVGLGQTLGLALDPLMTLAMSWFDNPNNEVRQSIVDLVAGIYRKIGIQPIEPYLSGLRSVQREVFYAEFQQSQVGTTVEHAPGGGPSGGPALDTTTAPAKTKVPPETTVVAENSRLQTYDEGPPKTLPHDSNLVSMEKTDPGSLLENNNNNVECFEAVDEEAEHELPPFQCQFCRKTDPSFTPEALDLHYWKDCQMLTECKYCQQVIEISAIRAHYLEECEKFEVPESLSGDGAPRDLPPEGVCALCVTPLNFKPGVLPEEDEETWLRHLVVDGCPGNQRKG